MCFRVEQVRPEAELFIEELRMSGSFCRKESSSYLLAAWNCVWGQEGTWGRGAGGLTVAVPVTVTWLWPDILSAAPHGGASHHPAVPLRMGTGGRHPTAWLPHIFSPSLVPSASRLSLAVTLFLLLTVFWRSWHLSSAVTSSPLLFGNNTSFIPLLLF